MSGKVIPMDAAGGTAANVWDGRSIQEALSEVNRELQVRVRCFPRWIKEGRVDAIEAEDRLDRLSAAKHFLEQCLEGVAACADVPRTGDMTDAAATA